MMDNYPKMKSTTVDEFIDFLNGVAQREKEIEQQEQDEADEDFGPEEECVCYDCTTKLEIEQTSAEDTDQTFYMVYVEDRSSPTVKHKDIADAMKECERLTKLTGKDAHLLKAVATCCPKPKVKADPIAQLATKASDAGMDDVASALLLAVDIIRDAAEDDRIFLSPVYSKLFLN